MNEDLYLAFQVVVRALKVLYLVLEFVAYAPYSFVARAAEALRERASRRPKLAVLLALHAIGYFHVLMIQMQAATLAG